MQEFFRTLVEKTSLFTWGELITALTGVWFLILAANSLARITETPKDNRITSKIKRGFIRLLKLIGAEAPVRDKKE